MATIPRPPEIGNLKLKTSCSTQKRADRRYDQNLAIKTIQTLVPTAETAIVNLFKFYCPNLARPTPRRSGHTINYLTLTLGRIDLECHRK